MEILRRRINKFSIKIKGRFAIFEDAWKYHHIDIDIEVHLLIKFISCSVLAWGLFQHFAKSLQKFGGF